MRMDWMRGDGEKVEVHMYGHVCGYVFKSVGGWIDGCMDGWTDVDRQTQRYFTLAIVTWCLLEAHSLTTHFEHKGSLAFIVSNQFTI